MDLRLLAALALLAALVVPNSAAAQTREVRYQRGQPIVGLLTPSDVLLRVRANDEFSPSRFTYQLTELLSKREFVGLVRVLERTGFLTRRHDWVHSRVLAEVVEVFKQDGDVVPGSTLSFIDDGGRLTIGDQEIECHVPWLRPARVGGTYAVFGDAVAGELRGSHLEVYEVVDGRLISRDLTHGSDDPVNGRRLSELRH